MKTPDDIKKGLAVCATLDGDCENCPYDDGKQITCVDRSRRDALAYIQQLEERNEKLENALRNLASSSSNARDAASKVIEDLKPRLAQAERERDAAVRELEIAEDCYNCKYNYACKHDGNGYRKCSECGECPCSECNSGQSQYEWRGVCEENTKEEER